MIVCPWKDIGRYSAVIPGLEEAIKAGVEILLYTQVIDTNVENGELKSVTIFGKGRKMETEAKVFIDATGDGDVGYMAGARYEKGPDNNGKLQPPTLMCTIDGVDVGVMGQIHPLVAKNYGMDCEVYCAEISFTKLLGLLLQGLAHYREAVRQEALLVIGNFLADLLYTVADPRIKTFGGKR